MNTYIKKGLLLIAVIAINGTTFSQVGIGTTAPEASSVLEIKSTTKGFLPPRMDEAQRDAISSPANPAEGLMIYNTDEDCLNFYNGTAWISMCGGGTTPVTPATGVFKEYVKSPNIAANENYGMYVTISGDGKQYAVGNNGQGSSNTYIYSYDDATQTSTLVQTITISANLSEIRMSGDGNTLILASTNTASFRVYKRNSSTGVWSAYATLTSGVAAGPSLRVDLSADGQTIVVGKSTSGGFNNGTAKVRVDNGDRTYTTTRLTAATSANDEYGNGVSISGDGTVIAVRKFGLVYIFAKPVAGWESVPTLAATTGSIGSGQSMRFGEAFGMDLSLDGKILAVGDYGQNEVEVFENSTGSGVATGYTNVKTLTPSSAGGNFGYIVSLNDAGDAVLVTDFEKNSQTGATYLFNNITTTAVETAMAAPNSDTGDKFGLGGQLSASGNRIIIGAQLESSATTDPTNNSASNAGAVYIFE